MWRKSNALAVQATPATFAHTSATIPAIRHARTKGRLPAPLIVAVSLLDQLDPARIAAGQVLDPGLEPDALHLGAREAFAEGQEGQVIRFPVADAMFRGDLPQAPLEGIVLPTRADVRVGVLRHVATI